MGYPAGVYTLQHLNDKPVWFTPPDADGLSTVVVTQALITFLNVGATSDKVVQCVSSSSPVALKPYGETQTATSAIITPPSDAVSVTIMVEPSSANPVEVSFDAGVSWGLVISQHEVKTWGDEIGKIDFSDMRIRGQGGVATFDIHGEKE